MVKRGFRQYINSQGPIGWFFFYICVIFSFASLALRAQDTQQNQNNHSGEQLVDRIVAVVNGVPILHSEIQKKIALGQPVILTSYPVDEKASVYDQALHDSINFELILQKMEEFDISVTDDEVDKEIDRLLAARQLSRDGLMEFLRQSGVSYEEYRDNFRKQILVQKFQGRFIMPRIKITDRDIEAYYLSHVKEGSRALRVVLRQIFVKSPQDAPETIKQGKKERVEQIYQKLKAGLAFSEAAKLYSDLPSAQTNGGLMPEMKLSDLNVEIRQHIEKLQEGEITPIITTPAGYYIFYLEKKTFDVDDSYKQQKKKLEFELRAQEAQNEMINWLKNERLRAKIKIINL